VNEVDVEERKIRRGDDVEVKLCLHWMRWQPPQVDILTPLYTVRCLESPYVPLALILIHLRNTS
jgi:hypothetical protein